MKLFGFFNIAEPWTLDNWRHTLQDPVLLRSIGNTLAIGVGSGMIGVLFYSVIAYVVVRTHYRARWILDFLSWLPCRYRVFFSAWRYSGLLANKNIFADLRYDLYSNDRHGDQEHAVRHSVD